VVSNSLRIKAKKLRGVVSYGLVIPAPADASEGDNLFERYGLSRYEPEEAGGQKTFLGGEEEAGPEGLQLPGVYDVDSFERYANAVFSDGEPVIVTEKLDGSNVSAVWWGDRLWVKSRKRWVRRTPDYSHLTLDSLLAQGLHEEKATEIIERVRSRPATANAFWQGIEANQRLIEFLKLNPGTFVFGELFGNTNRIKYGLPDTNRFLAFDLYRDGRFLSLDEVRSTSFLGYGHWVPCFNRLLESGQVEGIPFDFATIQRMAEGHTLIEDAKPKTIRYGVVVRPLLERWDHRVGRVQLKVVSPTFLEKM
jgi:RNA ligase (TIGR02306 family)